MKNTPSLSLPDPQSAVPMHARPHREFPAVLVTSLALLVGSARVFAGPAPVFPLEPAFELAPDAQPAPVPLSWAGGWVLAKVMINAEDAGWFMIANRI